MQRGPRTRSRYYLGTSGFIYLAAAAPVLAAALHTQANLLFWSVGLMLGGFLVSLVYSWLMLRGVTLERVLPPHAVAGEAGVIHYRVTNSSRWLPVFNLVVAEAWGSRGGRRPGQYREPPLRDRPRGWLLHIGPRQTALAEAPFWPTHRGVVGFERITADSSFPFGMLGRRIAVDAPAELTIYPHLFRVQRHTFRTLMHGDLTSSKHLKQAGTSEEFFGLREYRSGDRLRSIDWKRTARMGKLVSKDTSRPGAVRVMLLLDLTALGAEAAEPLPTPPPRRARVDWLGRKVLPPEEMPPDPAHPRVDAERAISLAASIICDAYFQGFPVGLTVWVAQCPTYRVHRSLPHRDMILDALARLDLAQPRDPGREAMVHPMVVVRPRAAGASISPQFNGFLEISAGDLEQHVVEIEGGAAALLTVPDRVRPPTAAREVAAWR